MPDQDQPDRVLTSDRNMQCPHCSSLANEIGLDTTEFGIAIRLFQANASFAAIAQLADFAAKRLFPRKNYREIGASLDRE